MADSVNRIVGSTASVTLPAQESYEETYELIYDEPVFDASVVVNDVRLPAYGTMYAGWSAAILIGKQARQSTNRGSPNLWTVTCQYSNQRLNDQDNRQKDPEQKAVRISWSTTQIQVFRERDIRGKCKCNSAGDPPIPVTPTYEKIRVATVKYFVRTKPAGLLDLANKINSNAFYVDGEYVPVHCCRVASIQCSESRIENGVNGRDITIQFEIGPQKTLNKATDVALVGGAATVENNKVIGYWVSEMLDQGMRECRSVSPYDLIPILDKAEIGRAHV